MNANNQTFDFIALLVFLGTLIFGNDVAAVVGPYVAIVAASALGASFALARREKTARSDAVKYFILVVGLAVMVTVGLAQLAQSYFPVLHERLILVPIALMIGFVGDDWPEILGKFRDWLLGFIPKRQP